MPEVADVRHLLSLRGVAKSFGPVAALRSVDLTVEVGEIHALLGANGAGKSTLVKVLSGVLSPDAGSFEVSGEAVALSSPLAARAAGIAPVFQDPALVPDLTVRDNIRLTGTDTANFTRQLGRLEIDVELAELVAEIPLPVLRMIDLARALAHDPALLLLDEITAALPSDYAEKVFAVMAEQKREGRSVLFISHRLAEVQEVCDRATVLRDGRDVETRDTVAREEDRIVAAMLGERAAQLSRSAARTGPATPRAPTTQPAGRPVLEVEHLSDGRRLEDVSFRLTEGEVLGIVALEGQGQDSLFGILSGDRRPASGVLRLADSTVRPGHPGDAVKRGVALVPADRAEVLFPQRSVLENLANPLYSRFSRWGWINRSGEDRRIGEVVDRLSIDIRAADEVRRLSGGNRQKVTIGRWLVAGFSTLLCFDPTRGIDVGTKHQIYDLVRDLAADGKSVLMFTSELREVPLACDRVLVLFEGRIVAELPAAEADEVTLLNAAHGLHVSTESA